jgi:hypothetical protein
MIILSVEQLVIQHVRDDLLILLVIHPIDNPAPDPLLNVTGVDLLKQHVYLPLLLQWELFFNQCFGDHAKSVPNMILDLPEFLIAIIFHYLGKEHNFMILLVVKFYSVDYGLCVFYYNCLKTILLIKISIDELLHGLTWHPSTCT